MDDQIGGSGPVDEISHESRLTVLPASVPRPRLGRGARLTALSTAAAVVLAGGVVTAAWRSHQPQHSPADLIPSSAFAVGTIDLAMPHGQADALQAFADHFPSSPTHHGDGSAVDRLLRAILRTSSDPHVDYDRDVKPWLGDHVAIAGWADAAGKPRLEVLLQSTDDGSARQHLTKLIRHGDGAVRFADGFAVLSDDDVAARAAIAAAHRSSLAHSQSYAEDVDALPGTPAATGWVDGPAVLRVIKASLPPDEARMFARMGLGGPLGFLGPFGLAGIAAGGVGSVGGTAVAGSTPSMLSGRMTVGVRVEDRYVEIDSRQTGARDQHQSSTTALRRLPASTIGALQLGDPQSLVTGATGLLRSFSDSFGGNAELSSSGGISGSCTTVDAIPPAKAVPLNIPHRRAILRQMAQARREFRKQHRTLQPSCKAFVPPKPTDPMKQIEAATGLSLPADAKTVLGDSVLASYGGLTLGGAPKVAVRMHPADLSAAQAVIRRVQDKVGQTSGFPLAVDADADDLVLATSLDYAKDVEAAGSFGDQAQPKLALGELPGDVVTAGYVNLAAILPLLGADVPRDVLTLKAIGFWTTESHGVESSQLRVVVG